MSSFYTEQIGSDSILHNKYGIYSRNELEFQIYEGLLTIGELAQIYDLKEYQMVHVLRSLKISQRNNLNDIRTSSPFLTSHMHQVLLGTLLGDAYMKEPKRYQVAHSVNQIDYLYHIAFNLSPFISAIGYGRNNIGEFFFLWTHNHYLFIPYFEKFYSHGKAKKYLRKDIIYELDARGLAYWYMDDGKYNKYGAYLCVGNITFKEGEGFIIALKERFGLECTFQFHNIEKGHYNIYIKAESRKKFFALIEPFIIPSMSYKLKGESPPKTPFSRELVLNYHKDLCSKEKRPIYFSGQDFSEIIHRTSKELYIEKIRNDIITNKQISRTQFRVLPSEDVLREMFSNGKTDQQIADQFKFGRNRIAAVRRSIGIPRKKYRK